MSEIVTIALVGAGGYGDFYLRTLATEATTHQVKLVGVVDPTIQGRALTTRFNDQIPHYDDFVAG